MSTRHAILAAADDLFYRRGFEATSFAEIATAVGISRGNFYHHFKTKDEILEGVIALRAARTAAKLAQWAQENPLPLARLKAFVGIFNANRASIMRHGCPVGTLCLELAKSQHASLAGAGSLFNLFRDWLAGEFRLLGHFAEAESLALHLLARSQGIATLAATFQDAAFVERETAMLERWLDGFAQPSLATPATP